MTFSPGGPDYSSGSESSASTGTPASSGSESTPSTASTAAGESVTTTKSDDDTSAKEAAAAALARFGRIATFAVLGLGVVNFLLGLTPQVKVFGESANFFSGDPTSIALLLGAGVIAGLGLLPAQKTLLSVAAGLSIAGFLTLVFQSFNMGSDVPEEFAGQGLDSGIAVGTIIVLVLGFIQAAVAVVGVLFESGILKPPAPKPAQPQGYGQQGGGFGGPGGYGQPQGYAPPQGYNSPQGYNVPQGYNSPQGYNVPQGHSSPPGYNAPPQGNPQGYGAPQGYSNPQGGAPTGYGAPQGYGAPRGYENSQQGPGPSRPYSAPGHGAPSAPQYGQAPYSQPYGSPEQQRPVYGQTPEGSAPQHASAPSDSAPSTDPAPATEAQSAPADETKAFDTRESRD